MVQILRIVLKCDIKLDIRLNRLAIESEIKHVENV